MVGPRALLSKKRKERTPINRSKYTTEQNGAKTRSPTLNADDEKRNLQIWTLQLNLFQTPNFFWRVLNRRENPRIRARIAQNASGEDHSEEFHGHGGFAAGDEARQALWERVYLRSHSQVLIASSTQSHFAFPMSHTDLYSCGVNLGLGFAVLNHLGTELTLISKCSSFL